MSDDRFESRTDDSEPPEPEQDAHRVLGIATVSLEWDGHRWQLAEPARLTLAEDEIICNHGLHADSPADRAACEIERERARGGLMPPRSAVAEAFQRATTGPAAPLLGV